MPSGRWFLAAVPLALVVGLVWGRLGGGIGGLLNATFGNAAEQVHWMEGVQLLAVCMILVLGFFFLPGA